LGSEREAEKTVAVVPPSAQHVADISAATDGQADVFEHHVAAFRRSFQRVLRRKPTRLQRELMDRAAILTTKAKLAALDSTVSPNDLVRLDGLAARARAEMFAMFAAKQEPDDGASDLDRYLQRRAAENEAAP